MDGYLRRQQPVTFRVHDVRPKRRMLRRGAVDLVEVDRVCLATPTSKDGPRLGEPRNRGCLSGVIERVPQAERPIRGTLRLQAVV